MALPSKTQWRQNPVMSVESPCVSQCQIGPDGYCLGCGRSLDEIRGWKRSSDDERIAILEQLPNRRDNGD